MEWTQENVTNFIELHRRKQIIWDPEHSMHFKKIKKNKIYGRNWEKK
jgi:hypothetical protein